MIESNFWQPCPHLKTHAGNKLTPDAQFFFPPPIIIGEIVSASTTLSIESKPMNEIVRMLLIFSTGIILQLTIGETILSLIGGTAIGAIIWYFTRFHHSCSYVGTNGIIEYKLTGSRSALPKKSLLIFDDVNNLYTRTTNNYTNGIYTGTDYSYEWIKKDGENYCIRGKHYGFLGTPRAKNHWHFVNSAESAWSAYLLYALGNQIHQSGYIEFPIPRRLSFSGSLCAIRVGEGFLEFVTHMDGEEMVVERGGLKIRTNKDTARRVLARDMRDVSLDAGVFYFKHKDSRWWSGKGKYSFEYADIPNAQLFVICLSQIARVL
jgi:hypothetical protein